MRAMRIVIIVILAVPVGLFGLLVILWLLSFVDPAPSQDDCAIGSVSKTEYLRLLAEAKAQDWTLWPGLSDGIFDLPARTRQDPYAFERRIGEQLQRAIEQLTFDHDSADAQLAAAHAVMRSIRAEYISVFEIPLNQFPDRSIMDVELSYFIPQRRFAPLCVHCLMWWYTTIDVHFRHDVAANKYTLDRVVVLNAGLKYVPSKSDQRNISEPCPSFPRMR
jgi:hypothetical protein